MEQSLLPSEEFEVTANVERKQLLAKVKKQIVLFLKEKGFPREVNGQRNDDEGSYTYPLHEAVKEGLLGLLDGGS
eukprot:g21192.t1